MTTKQGKNAGCGKVTAITITIIGLVGSCIAIFTFLTGIVSVNDIFKTSKQPTVYIQPQNTTNPNNSSSEQAVLATPTLGNLQGSVKIVITSGNNPMPNIPILFSPATKDIAGKWTEKFEGGILYYTDSNGIIETSLDDGTYAILTGTSITSRNDNQLAGSWGTVGSDANGRKTEMVIFSISAGIVSNVNIQLARLEIGLISSTDGNAIKGVPVSVYCQDTDIAGNKVQSERCESYNLTDERGVASLNLGAGTYIVKVSDAQGELTVYDLILQAGETRQITYKISKP